MGRVFFTAFAVVLMASFGGCGSDEPAVKDMTPAERQEQTSKQADYQNKMTQPSHEGGGGGDSPSTSKQYRDDAKKRSGS